ncbi:hypothetical protein BDV96DRAFT_653246 [Lophiotrema nucula]|uniref:Uncharacterized protein n=1 Tax=Lophiotrema nucula TaxID=690887 RepID=A0A6A5YM31_9PLEO|nr:hypothetical protein BDV96DRAFT_653246 [Lophiotrema nucula]
MAPSKPEETSAPELKPRYVLTVGTQAPLTTVWTAPGSCATNIPTLSAGTCNTVSCSAYGPTDIAAIFATYGASVNYPAFTTSQQQTSTECMPPGYANLKWFYFTGGSQCPINWATATTSTDTNAMTIVCCPSNYPSATYNTGAGNFDCFTAIAAAQQHFTLEAEGNIATSQIGNSDWVPSWKSRSVISTTAWPSATTAIVYHPGVNFLVDLPSTTAVGGKGNNTASGDATKPALTVFGLGFGVSIAVVVILGLIGLCALGCLIGIIKCLRGRRRRSPPPVMAPASGNVY